MHLCYLCLILVLRQQHRMGCSERWLGWQRLTHFTGEPIKTLALHYLYNFTIIQKKDISYIEG